ncbi:23693_t:CDS:2, partial [Cetraspora pellucida]
ENADLKNTLNQLRALGETDGQYREPKVSLPDKFDGTRSKFRGFLNQVRLVIRLQPNRYPNNQMQVGLLGSLLMGSALAWFAPLLEKQSELLDDFDTLVKELEAMFGDADKARIAANKIRKLVQGSRPASSYASEFRQISSDLDWGEAALIDQFRMGLRNNVKDLLLILEDPISLNDTISKAIHCDNRLFERSQEHPRDPSSGRYFNQVPNSSSIPTTEPMQIDAIKYRPLSAEEKERRRANNLCLYCEEPGHMARNCFNKSNTQPKIDTIVFPKGFLGKEQPQSHLPKGHKVNILALIDSGASACFLDITFAKKHNISFQKKETPLTVEANSTQEQLYVVQVFTTLASSPNSINIPFVPKKYQDFNDVFNKKKADKLPVNRRYDCAIDLLPDTQPPWGPIYELSTRELEVLREYIEKNLEKGFIHHSKSPAEKCEFDKETIDFLGYRITPEETQMDPNNSQRINNEVINKE